MNQPKQPKKSAAAPSRKARRPAVGKKVNWKKEFADAGKTSGRVAGRVLTTILNVFLTLLLIGLIVGTMVGCVFALYLKNNIDPSLDVDLYVSDQDLTTMLYYTNEDGVAVEMENERLHGSENRLWVGYSDIPQVVWRAFVCIEDRRFFSHHGVDWLSTGKSALNFLLGSSTRGGSTITQQLVKNLTQEDEVRVQRKIQEIFRALELEKKLSKEQILELYLNSVYLSRGCYGVQAASYKYFSKSVSELSLDEAACLASIIQSPSRYDPISKPENNKKRRQEVYNRMLSEGAITRAEYDEVYYKDLTLNVASVTEGAQTGEDVNSWFKDALIDEILQDLMDEYQLPKAVAARMLYSEGLQVYTTVDPQLQNTLEKIYLDLSGNVYAFPERLQSAAVLMRPNGEVAALVGGRGEKTISRGFNRATGAYRSPGSSIKPISVYAPALERGLITYGTAVDDTPVMFNGDDGKNPWPKNLPRGYNGLTTIHSAVERSVNTVAVRVLQMLTPEESFRFCKERAGMSSLTDHYERADGSVMTDMDLAPLALGALTTGVTVEDMASSYTMLANNGIYSKGHLYTKVYDKDGKLLLDKTTQSQVAVSAQTASIMTKMLQNVANYGTGKSITLRNKMDVAVKTGTAENDVDRWCVGYTPYYVCAVWSGYDEPKTIGTSRNPSVTAWDVIMTKVHESILQSGDVKSFEVASGVVQASFCADSGLLCTDACRADLRGNREQTGWFTAATVPQEGCKTHTLVKWDSVTKAVACRDCPESNVTEVGLIRVTTRDFPIEITVSDAEYVYRPWSVKDGITDSKTLPFFFANVTQGRFVGLTALTNHSASYNRYCMEHYVEHGPEEETTTEPPEPETTPAPEPEPETTPAPEPEPEPEPEVTPAPEPQE